MTRYLCECVFFLRHIVRSQEEICEELTVVGMARLDESDEAFCVEAATKSTTEAASRCVLAAFRLLHLHMK